MTLFLTNLLTKFKPKLDLINFCICVLKAANKKQKYERISEKKMSTAVEVLCKVRILYVELLFIF